MKIFRQLYFSDDTLRRIFITKKKRNEKNLYRINSFDFEKIKTSFKNERKKQKIKIKKSIEEQLSISAPSPLTTVPPTTKTNPIKTETTETTESTETTETETETYMDITNNIHSADEIIQIPNVKNSKKVIFTENKNTNNANYNQNTINGNKKQKNNDPIKLNPNLKVEKNYSITDQEENEKKEEKQKQKETRVIGKKTHFIIKFLKNLKNLKIPSTKNMMFLPIGGGLKNLNYIIPNDLESCRANFSFKWLFSILSLENILEIIRYTLLEKTIVFLSQSLRVLSCAPFAIFTLISPFKWQGAIMPIIPTSLISFIDSPVPVMLGITKWANTDEKFTSDYLLVNLDKNKVNFFNNSIFYSNKNNRNKKQRKEEFPKLPSYNELFNSIKEVFTKANKKFTTFLNVKKRGSNAIKILQSSKKSSYFINIKEEKIIGELQAIFTKYYNLLFTSFRNHTFSDVSSKDTCSVFLTESFLESIIPKDKPFMEELLKTQSFHQFSNTQLEKIQKSLARKIHNSNFSTKIKIVQKSNQKINSNSNPNSNAKKNCRLQLNVTQNNKIELSIHFEINNQKKLINNSANDNISINDVNNNVDGNGKKTKNKTHGKGNPDENENEYIIEKIFYDKKEIEQIGMTKTKSLPLITKTNRKKKFL
ncbi:denn (aex-3) domain-containing protein [Anaeramoeba flamelloides]|uniref:Denn (Aex-3) domain-containing protein n=1 Tax=Anaeramoeba flamelloides TaxID=1746091 RepID=A0AAV7Y2D4_9EUKA|nr:denn (aex-3) domain-containing protein [Anaeramoeba flamelloides]